MNKNSRLYFTNSKGFLLNLWKWWHQGLHTCLKCGDYRVVKSNKKQYSFIWNYTVVATFQTCMWYVSILKTGATFLFKMATKMKLSALAQRCLDCKSHGYVNSTFNTSSRLKPVKNNILFPYVLIEQYVFYICIILVFNSLSILKLVVAPISVAVSSDTTNELDDKSNQNNTELLRWRNPAGRQLGCCRYGSEKRRWQWW